MVYTIEVLRNKLFEDALNVYEVFKNYFGEANVDIQGLPTDEDIDSMLGYYNLESRDITDSEILCFKRNAVVYILVHWPEVLITNEFGKSILIKDFFAKVPISLEGKFKDTRFTVLKTTFNKNQLRCGYIHSHAPIFGNTLTNEFAHPCLGQGPIKDTIRYLNDNNDDISWSLFCAELDQWTRVESIAGGPYKKLEEVTKHSHALREYENVWRAGYTLYNLENLRPTLLELAKYYLKHGNLTFDFANNSFTCGMDMYDYIVDVSNCAIEWYNKVESKKDEPLTKYELFIDCIVIDRKFYSPAGDSRRLPALPTTPALRFKGRNIMFKLEETPNEDVNTPISTLLKPNFTMFILNKILKSVNYKYGNNYEWQPEPFATGKTVLYI